MLKLITSFASLGSSAAALYAETAKRAGGGRPAAILKALAKSERELGQASLKSAREVKKSSARRPVPPDLHELVEAIEDSFAFLRASTDMDHEAFLEGILQYEYHRWTGLIMPLAASLKSAFPGAPPLLIAAQRHKRRVERLLSPEGRPKDLHFRFRSSDPVWVERLLVVGSLARNAVSRNDVSIDVVPHGRDAVERLRERYYAAVLTDVDLEHLDGIEVCKKASRAYPGIEERFLFLYGSIGKRQDEYLRRKGLKRVQMPSPAEVLSREVAGILDR